LNRIKYRTSITQPFHITIQKMAGIMNKVKEAVHPHHNTNTGTAEGAAGPHNSRTANAADPRVDSDLDNRARTGGTTAGGVTGGTAGTGYGGTTGASGSTNAGPHTSNMANKLDPRVDSDMDGSRNMGAAGSMGTGSTGTTTGTGYGGTHTGNSMGTATGTSGGLSNSTNAGPHNSNLANKADPRVDSDLDGRGNRLGAPKTGIMGASGSHATPGSGTSQNTAGPHNSDMANKLDPRVDADQDGSMTVGGNRTNA